MERELKVATRRKRTIVSNHRHRSRKVGMRIKINSIPRLINSGRIKVLSNNFNIANDLPIAVYSTMGSGGKPMPPRVKYPKTKPPKRGVAKVYIKTASGKYYEGVLIKSLDGIIKFP